MRQTIGAPEAHVDAGIWDNASGTCPAANREIRVRFTCMMPGCLGLSRRARLVRRLSLGLRIGHF